jgi:hypothetical protein
VTLPGTRTAIIEVEAFFGDSTSGGGSIGRVVEGSLTEADLQNVRVVEEK